MWKLRLMDSLQVEELRGVMGFKEIPYLVQAYLVNKVCDLPDFLTPEGRKESWSIGQLASRILI